MHQGHTETKRIPAARRIYIVILNTLSHLPDCPNPPLALAEKNRIEQVPHQVVMSRMQGNPWESARLDVVDKQGLLQ
jgi:hypothetical protein